MPDGAPATAARDGWRRLAARPWTAFRRLPWWGQVLGWLVGFWILPAVWLLARAEGVPGVAVALLVGAVGWSAMAAAVDDRETAGEPAAAVDTVSPTPSPPAPTTSPSPTPTPSATPAPTVSPTTVTASPTALPTPTAARTPSAPTPASAVAAGLPEDGQATTVERIVDGDTLYLAGLAERARLIGIDTPETVAPGRPVECFGPEASAHLAELVPPGTEVVVTFDVERIDRYDRPLVYLYRASDSVFVNEAMVADGYAQMVTYPPNVRHAERFLEAQRAARTAGRGLWSADCGDAADDEQPPVAPVPAVPAPGGGGGAGGVVIADVVWDGPGRDVEYGTSEHVLLRNDSDATVDVAGWSLTDEVDHRITIPGGYTIPAGGSLRVHTGPGDSTAGAYHHGAGQAIWNNSGGDTATLRDASGAVVDEQAYSS